MTKTICDTDCDQHSTWNLRQNLKAGLMFYWVCELAGCVFSLGIWYCWVCVLLGVICWMCVFTGCVIFTECVFFLTGCVKWHTCCFCILSGCVFFLAGCMFRKSKHTPGEHRLHHSWGQHCSQNPMQNGTFGMIVAISCIQSHAWLTLNKVIHIYNLIKYWNWLTGNSNSFILSWGHLRTDCLN